MPIDEAFPIDDGTAVVTGRIVTGVMRMDDDVCMGCGIGTVQGIAMFGKLFK